MPPRRECAACGSGLSARRRIDALQIAGTANLSDPSSVSRTLAGKAARRERAGWLAGAPPPELCRAIAFVFPYAAVFLAFGAYPMALALWMARSPALYAE